MPPAGKRVADPRRATSLDCCSRSPPRRAREASSSSPTTASKGGWTHREFGAPLGRAVGVRARIISSPRFLLALGSRLDRLLRGDRAKLTADRVAYFCHPDWVASSRARALRPSYGARASTPSQGLADTAAWYQEHGWL